MAESAKPAPAVPLPAIAAFGTRLATALDTLFCLSKSAGDHLSDAIYNVQATSAAMRQLHGMLEADNIAVLASQHQKTPIFKDAGLAEIDALAAKCHTIYKLMILITRQAGEPEDKEESDIDLGKMRLVLNRNEAVGEDEPMPIDSHMLRPLNVLRKIRWDWLEPRMKYCNQQLVWLKLGLLLNMQVCELGHRRYVSRPAP